MRDGIRAAEWAAGNYAMIGTVKLDGLDHGAYAGYVLEHFASTAA